MSGGRYSILPYVVVHDEVCAGLVDMVRIADPVVTREIVLGLNPRRPTTAAFDAVRKIVHAQTKNFVLRPAAAVSRMPAHAAE